MTDNKKINYIATMLLHALGDTIGFKNGEWEFKNMITIETISELIFQFIDLGGINGLDLKEWLISDDTIFHIATAKSLLNFNLQENKFNKKFFVDAKNYIILAGNRIDDDKKNGKNRYIGFTTHESIRKFKENYDQRNAPYNINSGGNGVAMKSLCIGLAFHKPEQLELLIDCSITIGRMTHNSPIGYLAGFTSAYMTSLAIQGIQIKKWAYMLLKILESQKIKKYINEKNEGEMFDYYRYVRNWKRYLETRFFEGEPLMTKSIKNLYFRTKYYYENFIKDDDYNVKILGASGYCCMIMAYDCLMDCQGNWEKLIFYAILNPSDSDTVGAITAGLYGAYYGFGDVPKYMLDHLEEKYILEKLGNKLYNKFYLE